MNPEEFELLLAAQAIFARLARDVDDAALARCLLDAVTAGRTEAASVLRRCNVAKEVDRLRRAARVLRDTGNFVNAHHLERFATLAAELERRATPRAEKRRSDGGGR